MLVVDYIDIELGHPNFSSEFDADCYFDNQERFFEAARLQANCGLQEGYGIRYSLLVDDLDTEISDNIRSKILLSLTSRLEAEGFLGVSVEFESTLESCANKLIETLNEDHVLQINNRKYLCNRAFNMSYWNNDNLVGTLSEFYDPKHDPEVHSNPQFIVPLNEPSAKHRKYGCSLLTAVWYLRRLGVVGFNEKLDRGINVKKLVNILPQKFLRSEAFALDILMLSKPRRVRNASKKIEYVIFR